MSQSKKMSRADATAVDGERYRAHNNSGIVRNVTSGYIHDSTKQVG